MVFTITEVAEVKDEDKGSVRREIFIVFMACLPFFTHGVETTTLTSSAHSGHFVTSAHVPWSTTALVAATAISAPIYCYIIDKYGRKTGIFIVNLTQGASLVPLFLTNATSIILMHAFAGISAGGLFTVLPIYTREIASKRIRGCAISLMMVLTTLGYVTKLAMSLDNRMYLMTGMVMLQLILMLWLLESPSYYVMVGKIGNTKATLAKLKGLSCDSPYVVKATDNLRRESEKARANGKLTLCTVYRNKIWWDTTKIGFLLYTTMALCGSLVFLDQQKALLQLRAPVDPNNCLVIISMLAGSAVAVICITVVDRKYLLTAGYTIMAVSSGVLAVYTQVDLTVTTLRWLPVASLAVLVFSYGLSWALPIVIMVELFNFEIRASLVGIIYAYSQIVKLIHVHTFQYIEEHVGIYTMFYIFACINLYGAVYTLFAVPNIRHKTLREIEKQLKRIPLPA